MNPFDDETTQKYSDAMEQLKQMNSPKFGGHTNRINQAKKRHQDSLKAAEIEAKTIEEIWQPEFQNTLTRFYKKYNKDLTNATPRERVEYMYQDRIFAEHNTIGMGTDTAKVYFSDDESKSDFAKITKTYSNLPYFGRKTIGFGKWLKDFAPAFILDPINIAGGFIYKQALKKAGQELSEEIAKGTVKNLTEKQFNKEIQKKATLQAAKGEGILGASVSGYQDITQQMSEKEVGLTDEYDVKRTLIATAAGGALGYSAGYGISKIGGVVTKKQAKEMYNNAQGLKKSVDEDFGVFETPENLKTEKPVETQTKTEETVSESVIRNEDINVEKIRKTIRKEEEKLKRSTPLINVKNITPKKDGKNLEKIAQSAADSGKLRTETRKGLYEEIRKEAKSFLTPLNYKIFNSNLEVIEKISPDLAPTILAQNYNMRDANEKLMMIDKQIKKGSDAEQERLMPELLAAFINAERQLVKHQKIMEGISDALQTPKMANEITEAQRLRLEVRAYQQEAMSKLVADLGSMSSKEKLRAMQKMNELLGNPYIMKDFLNKAKRQNKQTRTSFSEALQEYSTANLLFDPTTHETNLLSGYLTFQLDIIKDFFTGVIMGVTNRQQARGQLNMALDLFASQAHFFNLAWKKAKLSFKANQIVGDSIETTYDGSKFRAMDSYVQQLRESKNLSARIIGKGLSPLAQFAYQSLRVLGAGDAAIKAMINRSQRVANVNQRMRTAFPDIIKQRKQNAKARKAIKNQENINDIKQQKQLKEAQLINPNKKGKKNSDARKKWQQFEDKKLKELKKFDVKISELRKKQKNLTPYEEKWAELYFQYEDEFGNFRNTASFSEEDIMVKGFDGEYVNTLDDLTKSVANDPQYKSRQSTFTQNLKNEQLDANQFFPDQEQSKFNIGNALIKTANKYPLLRVISSLHFIKTPANLVKRAWQDAPGLNLLNMEYLSLLRASDPVVRKKAQGQMALGGLLYSAAGFYVFMQKDNPITTSKTNETRLQNSIKLGDDYVNINRIYPLMLPYLVMGTVRDIFEKFQDMQEDEVAQHSSNMMYEYTDLFVGTSMSLFATIFSSNLATQDLFRLTEIFDPYVPDTKIEAAQKAHTKYIYKQLTKFIPGATAWRYSNKVLGDAEMEQAKLMDYVRSSTPYELLNHMNEVTGNKLTKGQILGTMTPKFDYLGNKLPNQTGYLLGKLQDPLATKQDVSARMQNRRGKEYNFTDEEKDFIGNLNIPYKPAVSSLNLTSTVKINLRELEVKSFKDPITKRTVRLKEPMNAYHVFSLIKNRAVLKVESGQGKQTLNEFFAYSVKNRNSQTQKKFQDNQMVDGKYIAEDYLLGIIRGYESYSRDWLKQNAIVYISDKKLGWDNKETTIGEYEALVNQTKANIIKQMLRR